MSVIFVILHYLQLIIVEFTYYKIKHNTTFSNKKSAVMIRAN